MNFIENTWDNLYRKVGADIDNAILNFLNANGYPIDSATDFERIREITNELSSLGLFIDYISFTPPYNITNDYSGVSITTIIYPFFNSVITPIDKSELLQVIQEKYNKGELK